RSPPPPPREETCPPRGVWRPRRRSRRRRGRRYRRRPPGRARSWPRLQGLDLVGSEVQVAAVPLGQLGRRGFLQRPRGVGLVLDVEEDALDPGDPAGAETALRGRPPR